VRDARRDARHEFGGPVDERGAGERHGNLVRDIVRSSTRVVADDIAKRRDAPARVVKTGERHRERPRIEIGNRRVEAREEARGRLGVRDRGRRRGLGVWH